MAKMVKIKLDEKPKLVTGKGFRIVDVDADQPPMVYQCEHCGKVSEVEKLTFIEDAGLVDILKTLIFGIPRNQCTMKDSINSYDFMQQLGESSDGFLKLTDGMHSWLIDTVKKHGPAVFGVNAQGIIKALDNTVKENEPAK